MKASTKQKYELQENKNFPSCRLSDVFYDEIDKPKQFQQSNKDLPISEIFKIEEDDYDQETGLHKFMLESSKIKFYKKEQQKQQFTTEEQEINIKSLKIVDNKIKNMDFLKFYTDLKRSSSFKHINPINTIVLVRIYDQLIWPALIVSVQKIETLTINKYIYKACLINSNKSVLLGKFYMVKFNQENIQKIKTYFGYKKLLIALKIAEKMFQKEPLEISKKKKKTLNKYQTKLKNILNKSQTKLKNILLTGQLIGQIPLNQVKLLKTKNLQKFIKNKQISLRSQIKMNNHQKQPINFIIETERVNPQQFKLSTQSQTDSDQQIEKDIQRKPFQKGYQNETQYNHQENQEFFESRIQNEKHFLISQTKRSQYQILKQFAFKPSEKKKRKEIERVFNHIYDYRSQIKRNNPNRRPKKGIQNILYFLDHPIENFQIDDFTKYSSIINALIQICINKELFLTDQDKIFIIKGEKILSRLYFTLKDYEGENGFIKRLKLLQTYKLKFFGDNQQKVQKPNDEEVSNICNLN